MLRRDLPLAAGALTGSIPTREGREKAGHMDVDRDAEDSFPAPAQSPRGCVNHVWTPRTPTTTQCQLCQLTVPTVPDEHT
jgi:hypothetical protein